MNNDNENDNKLFRIDVIGIHFTLLSNQFIVYSLWVRISVLLSFLRMSKMRLCVQESPYLQTIRRCLYAQA
jgi:hypothetical protein